MSNKKNEVLNKIESKDQCLVLFYATWCGFSQRFLPIFVEYQKSHPDQCLIVAIDELPDLCDQYDITVYPTVIQFRKGKTEKRLDSEPGVGLNKPQFEKFCKANP